jgi:flagellar basal body-associated protein FliL
MSSHESHAGTQPDQEQKNALVSARSSFWLVTIIVLVFISALNFIGAMSREMNKEEGGKEATEVTNPAPREGTASQTMAGESGAGKKEETTAPKATTTDTAANHH